MRNSLYSSVMARSASLMLSSARMVVPFDNEAGWKKTADGKGIEMKDGNPIWIDANGGEMVMQGDAISRLNGEAAALRKRAETAETAAKAFEGLDAKTAKEALETLKKIDQKKLIDAGEVDKVRETMKGEFTSQIGELQKSLETANGTINTMRVDAIFAGSEFIRDRIAVPRDMFEASMRPFVSIDKDGKPEFKDRAGNRLMSKKNIGQYAEGDEALELLVETHPQKDTILKANVGSGSGNGGNGGNRGNGRVWKRADWQKLPPNEQAAVMTSVTKGEAEVVD